MSEHVGITWVQHRRFTYGIGKKFSKIFKRYTLFRHCQPLRWPKVDQFRRLIIFFRWKKVAIIV